MKIWQDHGIDGPSINHENILKVFDETRQGTFPCLVAYRRPNSDSIFITFASRMEEKLYYHMSDFNAAYVDSMFILLSKMQRWLDDNFIETEEGYRWK